MAGDGGLNGSFSSVAVTNLTNHHDVRIKTENRAEAVGKGTAISRINWDLRNSRDAVLDWVLKCDDFAISSIKCVNHGVESSGLTGTSRTNHKNETARVRNYFIDLGKFTIRKT